MADAREYMSAELFARMLALQYGETKANIIELMRPVPVWFTLLGQELKVMIIKPESFGSMPVVC